LVISSAELPEYTN